MKKAAEIFYHGTDKIFEKFNLRSHALEGSGKLKFGYGVYVASRYSAAALYSDCGGNAEKHYVYTVEIPEETPDNHISFVERVNPAILERVKHKLGESIPEFYTGNGNSFRRYLAVRLTKDVKVWKKLQEKPKEKPVTDPAAEIAAADFLSSVGVDYISWPINWKKPEQGSNRAVFDDKKVRILKVEEVEIDAKKHFIEGSSKLIKVKPIKTNVHSVANLIQQYYPEYYRMESYPAEKCAAFSTSSGEWGIFVGMSSNPVSVDGVTFGCVEQLFQLMKFNEAEPVRDIYSVKAGRGVKMKAKHWETEHRRAGWGNMIVDAMKFCIQKRYEQSPEFRAELERSKGKYIVEDQTSFPKKTADTWGVKLEDGCYVGSNLTGRLLMEMRDNGRLEYSLPDDAFDFLKFLK